MLTDCISKIRSDLLSMQDLSYRDFHSKLMPTVDKDRIIGIRTPILRKYAKELLKSKPETCTIFLNALPHKYYEENNLHAFIIEQEKNFDNCITLLNAFLPHVDNWATCDCMNPKVLMQNKNALWKIIPMWISSESVYTARFGIKCLMTHFLDEAHCDASMSLVSALRTDEYYINMMIAWFFATALALQYEKALEYIRTDKLTPWCRNKAIQKAVESYRITKEQKEHLRTLKCN
ncbi:MAG: DNA alkylation repair protein [Clostridia bacterium]|nr:DNA alkylation repair protein [Clostridia bacterium]